MEKNRKYSVEEATKDIERLDCHEDYVLCDLIEVKTGIFYLKKDLIDIEKPKDKVELNNILTTKISEIYRNRRRRF